MGRSWGADWKVIISGFVRYRRAGECPENGPINPAALLDRLLHRCHLVNIRGNSYRMRRHMELSKAIHPTASRATDAERARKGGES